MGKLYRAFDSVLGKPVAIKVLSSKRPDSKTVLRFQQEAKMSSRLQHTNIVKVLDVGAGSAQELYLIMDLVEGKSLQDFIEQEGPLPVEVAVPLIMQMCDALTHAHNKGVIHRDIKPSNIMLADEQDGLSVRIVDFGLAILESRDVKITQTGDTIGTPLYISPEQINGDEIDFRADIYSLGCVIFAILAGHPPYRGTRALETFQMHLHDPIPSIADSGVEDQNVEELDMILSRLLAKSPADRYQSLNELKDDLSVFLPKEKLTVKKMDDASFNVRLPFMAATRVSKRMAIYVLLLVIGVPLLVMSLEVGKQVGKVPTVNELKLEQTHTIWAPPKETDGKHLFYAQERGDWHHMDCRVIDEDLKYLRKKHVVSLDLNTTRVKGWGLKFLKDEPLRILTLSEAKITDKDIHHVNNLKNLRALKMSYTWITDAGLKTINQNPLLDVVAFEGCRKLNDESILEILRIAPNVNTINLSFFPITSKGLAYLKSAEQLKCVTIGNNELSDEDLKPLFAMKNLTLIDINKCKKITDKTIKQFAVSNRKLSKLIVSGCPLISAASLDSIQRRMPKLVIERKHVVDVKRITNMTKLIEASDDYRLPDLEF